MGAFGRHLFLKHAAFFVGRTIISEKRNSLTRAGRRIVKLSINWGHREAYSDVERNEALPAYSAASTHVTTFSLSQ